MSTLTHADLRADQLYLAEEADALGARVHTFTYRGVRVHTTRALRVVGDGASLATRQIVTVSVLYPGTASVTDLQPSRVPVSHEEAAGYAIGMLDAVLDFAAPAPRPTVTRYRELQRRFHQLGRQMYAAAWDSVRPRLVEAYTHGASSSSRSLSEADMQVFIGRFEAETAARESVGDGGNVRPLTFRIAA